MSKILSPDFMSRPDRFVSTRLRTDSLCRPRSPPARKRQMGWPPSPWTWRRCCLPPCPSLCTRARPLPQTRAPQKGPDLQQVLVLLAPPMQGLRGRHQRTAGMTCNMIWTQAAASQLMSMPRTTIRYVLLDAWKQAGSRHGCQGLLDACMSTTALITCICLQRWSAASISRVHWGRLPGRATRRLRSSRQSSCRTVQVLGTTHRATSSQRRTERAHPAGQLCWSLRCWLAWWRASRPCSCPSLTTRPAQSPLVSIMQPRWVTLPQCWPSACGAAAARRRACMVGKDRGCPPIACFDWLCLSRGRCLSDVPAMQAGLCLSVSLLCLGLLGRYRAPVPDAEAPLLPPQPQAPPSTTPRTLAGEPLSSAPAPCLAPRPAAPPL